MITAPKNALNIPLFYYIFLFVAMLFLLFAKFFTEFPKKNDTYSAICQKILTFFGASSISDAPRSLTKSLSTSRQAHHSDNVRLHTAWTAQSVPQAIKARSPPISAGRGTSRTLLQKSFRYAPTERNNRSASQRAASVTQRHHTDGFLPPDFLKAGCSPAKSQAAPKCQDSRSFSFSFGN